MSLRHLIRLLVPLVLAYVPLAKAGGTLSITAQGSQTTTYAAFIKATKLLGQKQVSQARRVVTAAYRTLLNPSGYRMCLGSKYEERSYGYYFPAGQALEFFYADTSCVVWVRFESSGFTTIWKALRYAASPPEGNLSAQMVFGASQKPGKSSGKVPDYVGKLAYYEFGATFDYGVLSPSGAKLESRSLDWSDAGSLPNKFPILPSELR